MSAEKLIELKNRINSKFNRELSLVFENNGYVSLEDMAHKRSMTHGRVITTRKLQDLIYILQEWLMLNRLPY